MILHKILNRKIHYGFTKLLLCVLLLLIFLSGCSIKYKAVGKFEDNTEFFVGTVDHNLLRGKAKIDAIGTVTKIHCTGNSYVTHYPVLSLGCSGQKGKAPMTCTDGRRLDIDWIADSCTSGQGSGQDQYGRNFSLKFGLTDQDASFAEEQFIGTNSGKAISNKENTYHAPESSKRKPLHAKISAPDEYGLVLIEINTNRDTASLTLNGEEQGGRSDGIYSIKRVARVGQETKFIITVTDVYGNTEVEKLSVSRSENLSSSVAYKQLNPSLVKTRQETDAVAIIIGIADYKNLPRADFANDDARVFYDYAIRALGVKPENIRLLVDGDADDIGIYQAFKTWLPSRVRASTDVYVYYSGHGLPTADGKGLYLLPLRAHRDFIDKTAITQAEINAAIQAAKPKSVTVFLDSCYSGQSRSGETLITSARPVAMKAEQQLFPENFTVITASQSDQISSSSPDLKHGIFSYYLMRGMEGDADANKDGRITAGEMQAYLAENVARQAGMQNRVQQPQLIGDANRVLVGR
jgi:hypothetical protein